MIRAVTVAALLLLALGSLAGCRTPSDLCARPGGLRTVEIVSGKESNDGRPIAVELVYATTKPAAAAISKLRANEYFAIRDQLHRDFPQALRTQRWEIEAGQHVPPTRMTPPCNLAATYLFGDYREDGEHRIAVGNAKAGVLELREQDMVWTPK